MSGILKISEATTLALHTMFFLSKNSDRLVSTKEIASTFSVSENHLAKVLQRLVKVGYVDSIRGPKGGFRLIKKSDEITLLEIFELIEGKLADSYCLLGGQACKGNECIILGDLIKSVNNQVRDYLSNKKLSELDNVINI